MNIWNLHLLAKTTAEKESRMAVLVLEDALDEAGWFTPANAQRVYDVLLPAMRTNKAGGPRARPRVVCDWVPPG